MASQRYHRPRAPEAGDSDSGSDLDIDLQELDPLNTQASSRPLQSRAGFQGGQRGAQNRAGRIALRNLRPTTTPGRNAAGTRYSESDDAAENDQGQLDEDDDGRGLLRVRAGRQKQSSDFGDGSFPKSSLVRSILLRPIDFVLRLIKLKRPPKFVPELDDTEVDERGEYPTSARSIDVGRRQTKRYPQNSISNAKYTAWSFLPVTLFNEFSFFFNLYFLLVALSQIIPKLRIGYLSTYIAPLAFVLAVTLGKEAIDDIARRKRDSEANAERFSVVDFENLRKVRNLSPTKSPRPAEKVKKSRDLKVGDILILEKDRRFPADVVVLKALSSEAVEDWTQQNSSNEDGPYSPESTNTTKREAEAQTKDKQSGEIFIRTDQLDGETDWKLRLSVPIGQSLEVQDFQRLRITAGQPTKKINDFVGTLHMLPAETEFETYDASSELPDDSVNVPLTIDNTAWANTVLASSSLVLAAVVYTGKETRQALSTSPSRSKTGLLEYEINALTKILCGLTLSISIILVGLEGFESTPERKWYIAILRFLILFSTIIPISLRVNLDMGKSVYAWFIERDKNIAGAIVRTSTIPEELGRIEYLLSDKTGTLTQNEMEMKKIHVGTVAYANEAMDEVAAYVRQGYSSHTLLMPSSLNATTNTTGATRTRREIGTRVRDVVLALAICHSVTPTSEKVDGADVTTYQASSPDEIAIVRWTEQVGLKLVHRDRQSMTIQSTDSGSNVIKVKILETFPFTSEGKRMGIVVEFLAEAEETTSEIWFFQKGADTVMTSIVSANDWLDEETANMAREGLRTLVVGRKKLSASQYQSFMHDFSKASLVLHGREQEMKSAVAQHLEQNLELLGITGVEDKLQEAVKPSLELLRNAGVKIWMLTGDKVETARCVAISSKLVARGQFIHTIAQLKRKDLAQEALDFLRSRTDVCLLIDGESLALLLRLFRAEFISVAVKLPTVVACRCSPTQKADVAKLIRAFTKRRVCCIGDGGNDVSMIQAADVGVGIVGKEGRQASLAADFSINQFCHLTKLLVWHGRNSYKRSAKLAQFVIHRGLIISVCQTMYSIASKFEPNALYKDWLLVGYATVYTMFPVFSLVLDKDVDEGLATLYPELYKELTTGRSLSFRSFFIWVFVSIYQGGMIQGLSQILVEVDGKRMVAVSFTALVINELIMVAFEITTWHPVMIFALVGTAGLYIGSVPFLGRYFDLSYIISLAFLWRVAVICSITLLPTWISRRVRRMVHPTSWRKVRG